MILRSSRSVSSLEKGLTSNNDGGGPGA